jgi:hypothetical protein
VIYEGNKPIYVGSAGKGRHTLRYRIGDLFSDYQKDRGEGILSYPNEKIVKT